MWRWRTDFSPSQLLSLRDARRSLGESSNAGEEPPRPPDEVEPQMVVESLLSNEWGRREGRRGAARRRPEIGIPVNTFGREEIRREFAESFGLGERQGHWVLPAHGGGSSGDETDCGEG